MKLAITNPYSPLLISPPLYVAIDYEHTEIFQLLIEEADVNKVSYQGKTPLHRGANYGNVELCQLLLKHGALINAQDERGYTPLHQAVLKDKHKICEVLLQNKIQKANPNIAHNNGHTPLVLALNQQNVDLARLLIPHGADPFFICQQSKVKKELRTSPLQAASHMLELSDAPLSILRLVIEEYAEVHPNKEKIYAFLLPLHRNKFPKDVRKLICLRYFADADKSYRAQELINERITDEKFKQKMLALFPPEDNSSSCVGTHADEHTN